MDCSPSGSTVHGILQARILEWVAISFPGRSSWPRLFHWQVRSSPLSHQGSPRYSVVVVQSLSCVSTQHTGLQHTRLFCPSLSFCSNFAQIHVHWGILLLAAKCTLNNRAIHFDHWEYQQQRPCWDQMLTGQEPEYFLNKCEMVFEGFSEAWPSSLCRWLWLKVVTVWT